MKVEKNIFCHKASNFIRFLLSIKIFHFRDNLKYNNYNKKKLTVIVTFLLKLIYTYKSINLKYNNY
jgi:hypothetical protein